MTEMATQAQRISRETAPTPVNLPQIFAAEEQIAKLPDDDIIELQNQLGREPNNPHLYLWLGLAARERGQFQAAIDAFSHAIDKGCAHWRIGWYIAQAAQKAGQIAVVDQACAAVLQANPKFWFARELPKHARGYYSQIGQDKFVEDFFSRIPPRTKVFVEVGAFDGVHYSNVRRLSEKYGWTGISFEPVSKNYRKLSASYAGTGVKCVRSAVSTEDGELEINVSTYPHLPDWGSDVATFGEADTERWAREFGATWTKEKVAVRRLTRLLEEAGIDDFDFISIDTEGHDLEVLRSIDFKRYRPQLIIIEYGENKAAIAEIFRREGYEVLQDNGQDFIAQAGRRAAVVKPANRPQPNLEKIAPEMRERVLTTISCDDCETIPKVANAGEIIAGEPPLQVMHNGVKIVRGSYHGDWMTEIIRCLRGHHEPQEELVFHEVLQALPANACMIEAGCFWAYYSLWFHQAIAGGRNYLIEPNPEKLRIGRTNFEVNGFEGVFTHGFIGRDSASSAEFIDWDGRRLTMPRICVDDYVREHNIEFVHVLHADIQGAEFDLLQGARASIAAGKIGYVFLSTHNDRHGPCLEFLRQHGFHIIAEHTIAESSSVDGLIAACSPVMHATRSAPISRGRADALTTEKTREKISIAQLPSYLKKLNPHLLSLAVLPLDREATLERVNPLDLLMPDRFDLPAKHIYARYRKIGVMSDWGREVYHAHIRAFSNGTCCEGDGAKHCIEDYFVAFDQLLDDIKTHGFDPAQTLVPMGNGSLIIDGAHRVTACLLHGRYVWTLGFEYSPNRFDFEFFRHRGLEQRHADAIALEYCALRPDTFVAAIFPSAQGKGEEIRSLFSTYGRIVYIKDVTLNRRGARNLIREIYAGESWLGDWHNGFAGVDGKMEPCFRSDGPVRVFVFQAENLEAVKRLKSALRELFGLQNHSVHINDTHAQTLQLARLFLNENSIHYLNHAEPRYFERFARHLETYRQWLREGAYDPEHFCIDGSAVMAAYGLREAQDLDVLHFGEADFSAVMPEVNSHNPDAHHHTTTRDNIIFNPANHFHAFGLKFASLNTIRALKAKRNEGKDQIDVRLIDQCLTGMNVSARVAYEFTTEWFTTHEPHWRDILKPWAATRPSLQILEVGSFEGRSACWLLDNIMADDRSRLTCVDCWPARSSVRVFTEDMEAAYERFQRNIAASGKASQVAVLRESSSVALAKLPDGQFDLIYLDGDHGADAVAEDTRHAYRLLKPGGLLLWDDYYWSETVKAGVNRACGELGITLTKLGNNASYAKPGPVTSNAVGKAKIVGLIPARNEAQRLPFCLRALKPYVDAIVYLDDCSDDDSVRVVEALATECKVERIIRKKEWHRDEPGDRNALLDAGRQIGGTHFIVLDADEAFTANCTKNDHLRRLVLALRPGDSLVMSWIQLWRSLRQYRFDQSHWTYASKAFAFCDDRAARYESGFIHTQRIPRGLSGRAVNCVNYLHGVLHFQFVDWPNLQIKQAWYRCMERVRQPGRSSTEINQQYAPAEDETNLGLRDAPSEWFEGYAALDLSAFAPRDERRVRDVLTWFHAHGLKDFSGLDIWRVPWENFTDDKELAAQIIEQKKRGATVFKLSPAAQKHVAIAGQHLAKGDTKQCRSALERALVEAPGHPELLGTLGSLILVSGDAHTARKRIEESLEADPRQPKLWTQLATAHKKLKNRAGAEAALRRALDFDPNCIEALRQLTELYLERDRHAEAATAAHHLVTLAPQDASVQMLLGRALVGCGKIEEGENAFRVVQRLDPKNATAAEALGSIARKRSRQKTVSAVPAPRVNSSRKHECV